MARRALANLPAQPTSAQPIRPAWVALGVLCAAIGLTAVFWQPLWVGGGLVGGDTYFYYIPQKAYLADCLRAGEFPLWNNRVGWGYPLIAESQTGALYPGLACLYRVFEINTAYNAVILLHYGLAFVFTWMYARRLHLPHAAAGLAALVYTYGWFPPRICLEWAIIGGTWLPWALWCAESYLQSYRWRYAGLLTIAIAMQLLAGHFALAFITQLTVLGYALLRLFYAGADLPSPHTPGVRRARAAVVLGAVALGMALAAVQLAPTWELKSLSQRKAVGATHDPGYGHIPAWYLTQVVAPWFWYPEDVDLNRALAPGGSATNRVEAHLYFGMIPLVLLLARLKRTCRDRRFQIWAVLGVLALLYSTGAFMPLARHLPGFSFFMGPGRYGIVTTLAAGLLSGAGFAHWHQRCAGFGRWALPIVVGAATVVDLWYVSRWVTYAVLVPTPPISRLADSPLRKTLVQLQKSAPVRVFSDDLRNLATTLGVAAYPTYLGIGPAAYYDAAQAFPGKFDADVLPTAEQSSWLRRAGVTHIISLKPLDAAAWKSHAVAEVIDDYLNAALGRFGERTYLYELDQPRGRVAWLEQRAGAVARVAELHANRVVVEADSTTGGRLMLTDLAYPGWHLTVDGAPAEPVLVEDMFRGVDLPPGRHRVVWTYRPASLYWGAAVSLAAGVLLCMLAVIRQRTIRPIPNSVSA